MRLACGYEMQSETILLWLEVYYIFTHVTGRNRDQARYGQCRDNR